MLKNFQPQQFSESWGYIFFFSRMIRELVI
jgi:hypothetical protein